MSEGRRMIAAELVRPGSVELRDVPVPEPGRGELLVRVDAALTCGTDVKTYQRGHPRIPVPTPMGHEFAGTVAATGAGVTGFREGDPVACVPTAPCGRCRLCRRGRENLCPGAVGRMVFGAFAEYVLLPPHIVGVHVLHRPTAMPATTAAALEPLACVVHGADRVDLAGAENVVFIGDGPIALLFLQLARLRGAGRALVVGKSAFRLAAAARLGADQVVQADDGPVNAAVRDWVGGRGADVVVECVGLPETWEQAAGLADIGGEVLLYGGCAAGTRVCFDAGQIHYDEVDVKGAFHYGRADVRSAWDILLTGEVQVEPLVTHHLSLERLLDGLELVLAREAIKVAFLPR